MNKIKIAILISGKGRGSNMSAIIKACKGNIINGDVSLVIGINDSSLAMMIANELGVKTCVISPKSFDNEESYQNSIYEVIKSESIDLICLAGYMRLLGQQVLDNYKFRIMNVHAALIPMFSGKGMYGHHIHEAAIRRGVKYSGCTVHFIDENYDTGPIIKQAIVDVLESDTPENLAARILPMEHKTYVECVKLFSEGKITVKDNKVFIK